MKGFKEASPSFEIYLGDKTSKNPPIEQNKIIQKV